VSRAAEGVPVSFGLLQAEDVQAVEQRLDLAPGVEGNVRIIGPCVTGTEQPAGEDPAGGKCPADSRPVRAPRVNDKRTDPATGERKRFASAILPACARKLPRAAEMLPLLYLHGLSSWDLVRR
jgi:hypothetical protein